MSSQYFDLINDQHVSNPDTNDYQRQLKSLDSNKHTVVSLSHGLVETFNDNLLNESPSSLGN
jgi:hypothetical protein